MADNNILKLRAVAAWADFQYENWWLPPFGKHEPTPAEIVELYDICQTVGVETPEALAELFPNAMPLWLVERIFPADCEVETKENPAEHADDFLTVVGGYSVTEFNAEAGHNRVVQYVKCRLPDQGDGRERFRVFRPADIQIVH